MFEKIIMLGVRDVPLIGKALASLANGAMKLIYGLYFGVIKAIAWALDMLTQLFFIFSGMTPVGSKSDVDESIDIVNFFLTQDSFVKAYGWLCLVALGLIAAFTIAKIIKQDYFDRSGPRSKAPIFRSVALSFIAFICVIPVFYFMIDAVGALALVVMKAMGYKGGGIGTMLFNLSWDDGGLLIREVADTIGNNDVFKVYDVNVAESKVYDPNNFGWYSGDTFFAYYWDSYNVQPRNSNVATSEFYWYIFLTTGIILIMTLFKMIVAMITRLYKLISLFIIAPSPISQIVLDDGQKFKNWKDQVLQEALKVVGCVMSFMLFLMIATLTNDLDLMKFAFTDQAASASNLLDVNNLTTELSNDVDFLYYYGQNISWVDKAINALGKALILIAGAGAVQDMDGVLTPLLSGGKSSMDMGAAGKQVMDTVGGVGKDALGLATKTVGAVAGAVSSAITKGKAAKKRSLEDKMQLADDKAAKEAEKKKKEENEKAQTPEGGGTPGGGSGGTPGGGDGSEEAATPETNTPGDSNPGGSGEGAEEAQNPEEPNPGGDGDGGPEEPKPEGDGGPEEAQNPEEPKPEENGEGGPEEAQNPEEPKPEEGGKSEESDDKAENSEGEGSDKSDGEKKGSDEAQKTESSKNDKDGGTGKKVGRSTKRAIKRQAKSAGRKAALKGALDHMLRNPNGLLRTGLKSTVGFGLKTALRMVGLNKLADDGAKAINDNVFGALHDAEKNTADERKYLRQPSLRKQAKDAKKGAKDQAKIDKAMGKDYEKAHKKDDKPEKVSAPTPVTSESGPTPSTPKGPSKIGQAFDSVKQKFANKKLEKEALNDSNNGVNYNVDVANNSESPTERADAANNAIEYADNLMSEVSGTNERFRAASGEGNSNLELHSAEERQQMKNDLDQADQELGAATEAQANAQQEMNDVNSAVANNEYQRSQLVEDLHNGNEEAISKFVNNTPAEKGREGVLTELAGKRGIAEISKNLNNEKYKGVSQEQLDKAYRYLSGDTSKECYEAYHGKTRGGSVSRYGGVKDLVQSTKGYNEVMNAGYKTKNGAHTNQNVVTKVAREQSKIESSYESDMLKRSGNTLDDANNRLNSAENNYTTAENNFANKYTAMDRMQDARDEFLKAKDRRENPSKYGISFVQAEKDFKVASVKLSHASDALTKEMKSTYKEAKRQETVNRVKDTVTSCANAVKTAGNNAINTCKNTAKGIKDKVVAAANKPYEKARTKAEKALDDMKSMGSKMGKEQDSSFVSQRESLQHEFDYAHAQYNDDRIKGGKMVNASAAPRMRAVARKATAAHKKLVKERKAELKHAVASGMHSRKLDNMKQSMGLKSAPEQRVEYDVEAEVEEVSSGGSSKQIYSSPTVNVVEPQVDRSSFGGEVMAAQAETPAKREKIKVKIQKRVDDGSFDKNLGAACMASTEGKVHSNPQTPQQRADNDKFAKNVKDIPTPTIDTSDLENQLSKITSIPSAKDLGGKKFEDLGAYKKDVGDRYNRSNNSYKNAIDNAKRCVNDFSSSGRAEALKMAEKFIAEAANHRIDMENIKVEIDDKGSK